MREHKYQAWHKRERRMYIPNYLHFSSEGDLFGVLVKEGQLLSIDDFELREYTGLKDKNGKEIYEGDIIRAEEDGLGVIKYGVGCFYYEDDWNGCLALEVLTDLMVVGNVYEHPELINRSNDDLSKHKQQ